MRSGSGEEFFKWGCGAWLLPEKSFFRGGEAPSLRVITQPIFKQIFLKISRDFQGRWSGIKKKIKTKQTGSYKRKQNT